MNEYGDDILDFEVGKLVAIEESTTKTTTITTDKKRRQWKHMLRTWQPGH